MLQGSTEKRKARVFRERGSRREHLLSRCQMRENQEDGKKELRTSERKAGKNKSLEVLKKSRKPWGYERGKEMV